MEKVAKVCQDFLSDLEGYFTRILDFTWRVSDCEELVGVTHKGMELFLLFFNLGA